METKQGSPVIDTSGDGKEALDSFVRNIVDQLHDLHGRLETEINRRRDNFHLRTTAEIGNQMNGIWRGEHILRTLDSIHEDMLLADTGEVNHERYTRMCMECKRKQDDITPEENDVGLSEAIEEEMEIEGKQGPRMVRK